jgi:hypothetical protein
MVWYDIVQVVAAPSGAHGAVLPRLPHRPRARLLPHVKFIILYSLFILYSIILYHLHSCSSTPTASTTCSASSACKSLSLSNYTIHSFYNILYHIISCYTYILVIPRLPHRPRPRLLPHVNLSLSLFLYIYIYIIISYCVWYINMNRPDGRSLRVAAAALDGGIN